MASEVSPADGYGDRAAAVRMARSLPGAHQKTPVADKGYDTRDFVADIRFAGVTPHVAQNIQARRAPPLMGEPLGIRVKPDRSTPGTGSSRCLAG